MNIRVGGVLLLLAVMALVCLELANGAVTKAWVRRYNNIVSNSQDVATTVLRDQAGNIIVAAYTHDGAGTAMLLLKYSGADGALLWQRRHDNVILISAGAVDAHGNVAVAGYSSNGEDNDYFVAKYSTDGVLLWTRHYDGPSDDRALAVAFDSNGNVVVTGGSSQDEWVNDDDELINYDYYTAKYAAADGTLLWERRYNGPANGRDLAQALAIDPGDNVVVTGASYGADSTDVYTAKYAGADGALLWDRRSNGGAENRSQTVALALDAAGNAMVAGSSTSSEGNRDAHTIKYAATDGALLWEQRYDGPARREDALNAVTVDGSSNVVVTGYSVDSQFYRNTYTAKYAAADGRLIWERLYSPTNTSAAGQALAVDAAGNVVMTGYSVSNYWDHYTAKYSASDGALLWERRHDGPTPTDRLKSGVVLDPAGDVFVTGSVGAGHDPDVYTAKYAATDGSVLWQQRYAGLSPDGGVGECVAIDASGNVFVSGSSEGNDSSFDYYTAKYSPTGALLWERRYDGPLHSYDEVRAMALDPSGNPIVTGYSAGGTNAFDIYTVKYAAGDGAVLWEHRYDGPGHWDDRPSALAVDGSGNVVVTGFSTGLSGTHDRYTARHAAADGALLWEQRSGVGGNAVAVDGSGNVLVTSDYEVAKYAAANGALLWRRGAYGYTMAVKADGNGDVFVTGRGGSATAKYASADGAVLWLKTRGIVTGWALALDAEGNAIVTGGSYDRGTGALHVIKYSSADGALLWERQSAGPSNDLRFGTAVMVDDTGNAVVAGYAWNQPYYDYFTAKYAAADGAVLWEQLYDGQALREDRVDNQCGVAVGPDGMVAVTGVTDSYPGSSVGYGITTVVYRDALEPISIELVSAGVRLRFTGEPGRRYTIQRAVSITGPWETFATADAPSNGIVEHVDSPPPGPAFYRTLVP